MIPWVPRGDFYAPQGPQTLGAIFRAPGPPPGASIIPQWGMTIIPPGGDDNQSSSPRTRRRPALMPPPWDFCNNLNWRFLMCSPLIILVRAPNCKKRRETQIFKICVCFYCFFLKSGSEQQNNHGIRNF